MLIASFIGGITVLLFGLIVRFLKVSGLIAGYNTMPQEEREKVDEEKLTRFVGNFLLITAAIILVPGVVGLFINMPGLIFTISWILFIAVIIIGVIFMNTGDRF